jgi:Ohr subfamily peroxiredoxin
MGKDWLDERPSVRDNQLVFLALPVDAKSQEQKREHEEFPMPEKILYTAVATATGGREGRIRSSDGVLEAQLAVPKEMGGPGGAKTNPEQLFASGYAACFEGAVRLVAKEAKVTLGPDTHVTAHVGIGPRKAGGFGLAVKLDVHLDGVDQAKARTLAQNAHENICPYSHATRGNVAVEIAII